MRVGVVVGVAIAAVFVAVVTTGTVVTVVQNQQQQQAEAISDVSCDAAVGPSQPGNQNGGAADAQNLDNEQRGTVELIVSIGQQRDLSSRAWQIAIQAAMTESGLRNLGHGDRDSLGFFQMRHTMGWGTISQLRDPHYQVNKFFDVLQDVPNWQDRRPGESAQAVERSAFPSRYHKWEPMAVHLVENVGEVADAAGCGEGSGPVLPPNDAAAAAIQFALEEQGKPYVWGATGPNSYDCSGLTLRAFEAAGITLPRVSRAQYHAGAMLPSDQAQPGDLLFWGYDESNPATIHHVAIYMGNGEIVEAQQTGVPVHTRSVSWDENQLLPQAIRPGA